MQQKVLDGRYELDRKIGEGGMARIYAGRDLRLNRRVAIKIPHSHFSGDADFIERFRHEAQAAAMLSHPNIVDVFDVGKDGDINYIVMEYVEGTDLKTLINREAPLAVARAVAIAEQIARGLHAAHRAGMVHRDIKPQNVIITADGQARVTDFGVSKSHMSTALTETGVSFGTVDYLSPEQAQGRPATAQSDVYALGVTLFEMLTGRLPFTGDSAVAVAMKHVTEPPPSPRALNPAIPVGLEALILRALAKDPAQRPRGADDFARLLAGYEQSAAQATMVNQSLPPPRQQPQPQVRVQQGAAPLPQPGLQPRPQPRPQQTGTGRVNIPPPRTAPARAPRQEGIGCGVFLVGMLVMAGVLGLVFFLSTGALNGFFAGLSGGGPGNSGGGSVTQPTETVEPGTPTPTPEQGVAVPDLTGFTDVAADQSLRQLQLIPVRQERNDPVVEISRVISQEVAPGITLLPGQPVTYTVSLGPRLVEIPGVIRQPASIAQQRLGALGLPVEIREEPSREIDAGFVVRQQPSAGLQVAEGSVVVLTVSLGDVVRFPEVIGLDLAEAEQIIARTDGLSLNFVDEQGPDRLPGYEGFRDNQVVSAQIVNGPGILNGEYVPRGSEIVLGVKRPGG
jgi:serine/threonine-protein kinase